MKHASPHPAAIELLESRIAPAGLVTVAFAKNNLSIMLDPLSSTLPPKFQTKLDGLDFTAGVGFSF